MGAVLSRHDCEAMTPVCSDCGVFLCWDISIYEYDEAPDFWDDWVCRGCNGGEPLSLKEYMEKKNG